MRIYTMHYINVLEIICIFVQNLRNKLTNFYRKTQKNKSLTRALIFYFRPHSR